MAFIMEEKWKKVEDNMGLIHIISQRTILNNPELNRCYNYWYEEFIGEGKLGLIKAIDTYDDTKSEFSTYAGKCIENRIKEFLRKEFAKKKGYAQNVSKSLDEHLNFENQENSNADNFCDTLIGQFDVIDIDKLEEKEFILKYINIILNCLSTRNICSIFYFLAGKKQKYIADKLHISQSYISKIKNESFEYCREILYTDKIYSERFCLKEEKNEYILTISTHEYSIRAVKIIDSFDKSSTIVCRRNKTGMTIWTQDLDEDFYFVLAEIFNKQLI